VSKGNIFLGGVLPRAPQFKNPPPILKEPQTPKNGKGAQLTLPKGAS